MSSSTFNAPENDQVPYTISLATASGAPYTLQAGDVLALTSTDGHSTVTPNPADPTGATGTVSDANSFVGPVTGALSFTPGALAAGQGIQPVLGTWTGTWDAVAQVLTIAVAFGAPASPESPAASAKPA